MLIWGGVKLTAAAALCVSAAADLNTQRVTSYAPFVLLVVSYLHWTVLFMRFH